MQSFEAIDAKRGQSRRTAMGAASVAVLASAVGAALAGQAHAQTAAAPSDTIVVTASRITSAGFNAPTPTTVIGIRDIEQADQPNVINALLELPSMNGFVTQQTVASATTISGSVLNLRKLGQNRVLVLVDGQRTVGAQLDGSIDISQLPQQLIKRVDVVTGGASASWGSNAVSGVVNFVLDNNFTGFKANIGGGITTYSDDPTTQIQMAAGHDFLGGRAHAVVAVDLTYDGGVHEFGDRPWYTANKVVPRSIAATPPGQPQYVRSDNVYEDQVNPGGIITAGPLKGTYFGPGGTPAQFVYGTDVNDPFMIGGQDVDLGKNLDLAAESRRGNIYGRFTYNLTPNANVWTSFDHSEVRARLDILNNLTFTGSLTIQCDNAYLPASITAQCAAAKITSFAFGTSDGDIPAAYAINDRIMDRIAVGSDGDFQAFGSKWSWDAWAEYSVNSVKSKDTGTIMMPLYTLAIDAVKVNGNIVCRSALAQANGCVPLNIIGTGVANPAAIAWIEGSGRQPSSKTRMGQTAGSASINGQPFSDWAGPVSVAGGVEYRMESYTVPETDPYAIGNGGNPLLAATGNNWFMGNTQPASGGYNVVEGFVETGVPVFDTHMLGKANLDLSARQEKYSTAGDFTTWKVGVTWDTPIDGVRFRGLQSKDVRAPALGELFAPVTVGRNTVVDNVGVNAGKTFTVANQSSGNPDLKPEQSINTQFGMVFQPSWLRGFHASVDYWNIILTGGVASLTPQQVIDVCGAGNATVCGNILRTGGVITQINTKSFNLSSTKVSGIDIETSYVVHLDDVAPRSMLPASGGQLTFRVLATNNLKYEIVSGVVGLATTDVVGQLQGSQSDSTVARWRVLGTEDLDFGKWGLTFTERFTTAGVIQSNYLECSSNCPVSTIATPTINDNHVPSTLYLDIGGRYALTKSTEGYFKIDNVMNSPPTLAPIFNGRTNINQNGATGELLGRYYRIGLRIRY